MKLLTRSFVLSLTLGAGLMMGALPPVHAATVTFVTPTGATTGGGPVDASATFTTGTNSISVSLSNLQANITDVAQALSDLFFTYSGSNLSGQTLTSSSGQEITVAGNGTFTTGATVAAGWVLSSPASNTLLLNDLGAGGAGPAHLIIGPPGAGNVYSNANGSIAGNGPHNPFLNQTAMFAISLAGITADTTITSAIFSFGTTAGINVPGVPSGVPLPGALPLFATGLAGLGLMKWRKKRKAPAAAA
jgi:hypothetical protein